MEISPFGPPPVHRWVRQIGHCMPVAEVERIGRSLLESTNRRRRMEMGNAAPGNPPEKSIDTGHRRTPRLPGSGSLVGGLFKSKACDDECKRLFDELFFEGVSQRFPT